MILKEKSYRIRKIERDGVLWKLYPKGSKTSIDLSVELVYGDLPPRWKFPWNYHDLTIRTIADKYVVYAEMDGLILFEIPESQYPEEVKKAAWRIEKIESEYAEYQKKYADTIKTQLKELLPKLPPMTDLEEKIGELPVCWRAYLRMHLFMPQAHADAAQRLLLSYHLVKIADRLYRRHVDVDSPLSVSFRSLDFAIYDQVTDSLNDAMIEELEKNPDFQDRKPFVLHNEAKQELERALPKLSPQLKRYLNQQIHRLLAAYSEDYATLVCLRPRDFWGDTINTDNEAYRYCCKKMKLPKLSSFVLERSFSDEEVEHFNFVF